MSNFIKLITVKMKESIKYVIDEKGTYYVHEIIKGIKYVITILFLTKIAKNLIEFPIKVAYKYNINISGEEYFNLYGNYNKMFIYTLIIIIVALPVIKLVSRLKHASKDGLDFYEESVKQDTQKEFNNAGPQIETIKDIIKSDDKESFDEDVEEKIYKQLLSSKDDSINVYKCKNIKSIMKPLTLRVANDLYSNSRENINMDVLYNCVKRNIKRKRKMTEERYKEISENIIYFLINNDIIESDDLEEEKYYFTSFGNIFINYFQNGII